MQVIHIIGLISDTHGLLRREALDALAGSDLIIHAGDVGDLAILRELRRVAPVVAVRGNIDIAPAFAELPDIAVAETAAGQPGSRLIYILHNLKLLGLNPRVAGITMVVSGHTHKPSCEHRDGITYVNPGAAGPRRFNLPVTIARVDVTAQPWRVEIVELLNRK